MHKMNENEVLDLMHQEILSLTELPSYDFLNDCLSKIISIKDKCVTSEVVKVSFSLLEKGLLLSRNNLFFQSVCEFILENIKDTNMIQYFRMILVLDQSLEMFDLLLSSSTIDTFFQILKTDKDLKILKNASVILTNFYEKFVYCINLEDLTFLIESEHLFFRSAYLILLYKQVNIELKGLPENLTDLQLERICEYISVIIERTLDYHYIIRSKAISLLSALFKDRFIPKNIRKQAIDSINQRILDKTQMVRKKAISTLNVVLLYHPFLLNKGSLKVLQNESSEYVKDLQEFVEQIKFSLKNLKILIKEEQKFEAVEILTFLNLAYFYKINDVIPVYEDLFVYTQNNYELLNNVVYSLLELFTQIPNNIFNFFSEFEPSLHLQLIIQMISKKGIFKKNIFTDLFKELKEKKDFNFSKNALFFLSCTSKYLDLEIKNILEIIQYVSDELFMSKNHSDLLNNVQLFRHMLNLVLNYKDKGLNNEIITKIIKIFIKMNFFDPEINKKIIKICFESGKDYENVIKLLLKLLNTKNTNKLKLIYSVGCIVEEQGRLLDLIENKVKKLKNISKEEGKKLRESIKNNDELRKSLTSEIPERRRSINLSRLSFHGKLSDVLETEKVLEKVKNKPEEEILDILYYVKEKELLYSSNALLFPYVSLIIKGCKESDNEIVNVSYLSLLKCMSISSIFFEENIDLFFQGLTHSDRRIRNNCVVTIRDFFLNYNFILEKKCNLLFNTLNDSDKLVRKHSIFIIFDLLIKNIIKLKNSSSLLSELLIDKDEEIKKTSYYLFNKLVKSSSASISLVPNVFFESLLLTEKNKLKELIPIFFTLISDKAKEICFQRLLRKKEYDKEMLKFYLERANFSEKFVEEMKAFEEFNLLINN